MPTLLPWLRTWFFVYPILILLTLLCMRYTLFAAEDPKPKISIRANGSNSPEKIDLQSFRWLAGVWEGKGLGGDCVEVWSTPCAESVVGSFIYSQENKLIFTEHFLLSTIDDYLTLRLKHFDPKLVGWEEKDKWVDFRFIKRDGDRFYFDRLTYVKVGDDQMKVYVLMQEKDGEEKEIEFTFKRTRN